MVPPSAFPQMASEYVQEVWFVGPGGPQPLTANSLGRFLTGLPLPLLEFGTGVWRPPLHTCTSSLAGSLSAWVGICHTLSSPEGHLQPMCGGHLACLGGLFLGGPCHVLWHSLFAGAACPDPQSVPSV